MDEPKWNEKEASAHLIRQLDELDAAIGRMTGQRAPLAMTIGQHEFLMTSWERGAFADHRTAGAAAAPWAGFVAYGAASMYKILLDLDHLETGAISGEEEATIRAEISRDYKIGSLALGEILRVLFELTVKKENVITPPLTEFRSRLRNTLTLVEEALPTLKPTIEPPKLLAEQTKPARATSTSAVANAASPRKTQVAETRTTVQTASLKRFDRRILFGIGALLLVVTLFYSFSGSRNGSAGTLQRSDFPAFPEITTVQNDAITATLTVPLTWLDKPDSERIVQANQAVEIIRARGLKVLNVCTPDRAIVAQSIAGHLVQLYDRRK